MDGELAMDEAETNKEKEEEEEEDVEEFPFPQSPGWFIFKKISKLNVVNLVLIHISLPQSKKYSGMYIFTQPFCYRHEATKGQFFSGLVLV